MLSTKVEKLTPEQEALIPVTREKWKSLALSTELINRHKATASVKAAYAAIGLSEPEVIFFDSLYAALKTVLVSKRYSQTGEPLWGYLRSQLWSQLGNPLERQLDSQLDRQLKSQLWTQLGSKLESHLNIQVFSQLWSQVWYRLGSQLEIELRSELQSHFMSCIQLECWTCNGSLLDFGFSVLNCAHDELKWSVFQSLIKDCNWIYPFETICFVCDRPIKFSFDNENRLHAEGEPAIEFRDGFSVYAYHGVTLPEKYGKLHPHQWRSQWLLEEDNAELRRILIEGIGYSRICQQLQATELDSWQEYTLLRIDNDVDIEPIYLLKMTCPSTGYIHTMRVPPTTTSAREAICWVNWGTDPEEFSLQT